MSSLSGEKVLYAHNRIAYRRLVRIAVLVAAAIAGPTMVVRQISDGINLVIIAIFGWLILQKTDPLFGGSDQIERMSIVFSLSFIMVFSGFIGFCFDLKDCIELIIFYVDGGPILWLLTLLVSLSLCVQFTIVWRIVPIARMSIDPSYSPPGLSHFGGSTELLPRSSPSPPLPTAPFAGTGQRLGRGTE